MAMAAPLHRAQNRSDCALSEWYPAKPLFRLVKVKKSFASPRARRLGSTCPWEGACSRPSGTHPPSLLPKAMASPTSSWEVGICAAARIRDGLVVASCGLYSSMATEIIGKQA